jgi:hypothetical protein
MLSLHSIVASAGGRSVPLMCRLDSVLLMFQ